MTTVNEFKDRMDSTLAEAKSTLAKAKEDMAQYYNQCRVPAPEYQVRDKVFLDTSDIRTVKTRSPNSDPRHRTRSWNQVFQEYSVYFGIYGNHFGPEDLRILPCIPFLVSFPYLSSVT
jgi:hypothetical protein